MMNDSNKSGYSSSTHTNVANQSSNSNNLIYNLPQGFSSRAMCSIQADEDSHKFIVGTCSLSLQNEIHLLNFAEDTNRVDLLHVFPFP